MKVNVKWLVMGLVVALAVSVGILLFINRALRLDLAQLSEKKQPQSTNYPLLANRIFVENPNDTLLDFAPLRKDLRQYFGNLNLNYSFYMEYLPTGTSIKINQDNPMTGASLLKVPVVMNLFHAEETGKIDLNKTVSIHEGDIDKRSGTLWEKGVGYAISMREAARYAIVDSDNTAVNMLIGATSGKIDLFGEVIDELDVELSAENNAQTGLGAQGYSSMLKCLYLSCFNSYANSQQILSWMAESNSPPRLKAGVPNDVTIAHKYGTSGGVSESDCGIIYLPKRPYLVCIMVGADVEQANAIIQTASRKVYDYISEIK